MERTKTILTDRRIKLSTWVKFLTACVRSRLTYSIQACNLNVSQMSKLESTWMNLLRKLVRNGFQRVNVSPSRRRVNRSHINPQRSQSTIDDDDVDWRFKLNNMDMFHLTCSGPIRTFNHIQHLKFLAHITRLPNAALQ